MKSANKPQNAAISDAIRSGLIKQLLREGKITERVADDLLRATK